MYFVKFEDLVVFSPKNAHRHIHTKFGPIQGLPNAQMVKNLPAGRRPGFDSWVGKIPEEEWQPTRVLFCPGESSTERKSLVGYSLHRVTKSQTPVSD